MGRKSVHPKMLFNLLKVILEICFFGGFIKQIIITFDLHPIKNSEMTPTDLIITNAEYVQIVMYFCHF